MSSETVLMDELTGQTQNHLISYEQKFFHKNTVGAFARLKKEASLAGISIKPKSSFRSFDDQMQIWNAKASGNRPVLDDNSDPINFFKLSEEEILKAILRFSALPGLSRHHWGTDCDIYDEKALPSPDYQVQLIPQEYSKEGHFNKLTSWLSSNIEANTSHDFYNPFAIDFGGVAVEQWHISHYPVAKKYINSINLDFFKKLINSSLYENLLLKETLSFHLEEIFERYIIGPT